MTLIWVGSTGHVDVYLEEGDGIGGHSFQTSFSEELQTVDVPNLMTMATSNKIHFDENLDGKKIKQRQGK